ncbi:uncharacterized protein LOC113791920 isoform X1 [Dermatophagoides pteronyssinus]|uniref:uncharacterized protein LOC113791920 isoform X1 n=2 Tax=Dermatophagoides pteronyssinus TaxID=6956 RepID=UPI003F674BD7
MNHGQMSSCHLAISSQPKMNLQQNTLSAFVNNNSHHHHHHHNHSHNHNNNHQRTMTGIEDCRHIRPLSPVEEHRMLLSNSNGLTLKTTPSQHQTIRCDNSNNLNNEINNQSSLSSTLPHRNHKKSKGIQSTTTTNKQQSLLKFNLQPGHSNTLPTNSTLSSLMAANGHSFGSNFLDSSATTSDNMNQHYLNQQRQLRRQISLNNLDKMINSSSSMTTSNSNTNLTKENSFHVNGKQSSPASNSTPSTSKVSLFQQKIRAILSPSSINKDNNQTQTTLSKSGSIDIDHNDKRQNESTYRSYGNLASSTSIQYNVDKEDVVGRLEPKIKQEQKNCANNKNSESSSSFNDNDFNGNNNNNHNHNEASLLPSTMQQWQSSSSTMVNPNLSHYHQQQQQQHIDSCLLNTLNKYTISASVSNNLNNLSASTSAKLLRPSSNELETMMMRNSATATIESDHYDLRTVCNKLFANKQQYPCVQSTNINPNGNIHSSSVAATSNKQSSDVLSSMMQKSSTDTCFRNITPEMNVDKVTRKESLYSFTNKTSPANMHLHLQHNNNHHHQNNGVSQPTNTITRSSNVDNNSNEQEAVTNSVVVNDTDDNKCSNGLIVRSSNNNSDRNFVKQIINNHHPQQQQQQPQHQHQGSTLSLNGVVEPTESVESHDHNYKSSSESGRGTMNSHTEDRNNLDVNSPGDLTSLDSDQSNHQIDTEWNKLNDKINNSGAKSKQNFNKLQRYLEPRSSSKDNELNGTDFRTKLSMNDETDSWTSLSDDLGTMNKNPSTKTKTTLNSNTNRTSNTMPSTMSKNRYHHQIDSKLKTDFSKPENCLNSNLSKQTKASTTLNGEQQQQSKPMMKLPPNPHKFITEPMKAARMNTTTNNILPSYDKCIYSVPDKGKYRNHHQHHYNANEILSATSNHNHHHHNLQQHQKLNEKHNHHQNHCSVVVQHGDDDDDDDVEDCGATSIVSSETNFPGDGCSEYLDDNINIDNRNARHHNDPLRKQLKGIEDMYSELLTMLNHHHGKSEQNKNGQRNIFNANRKTKLFRRNSGRSSVASRNTRDHLYRKHRHDNNRIRSRSEDNSQVLVRCQRLESQVLTLAKSVSQLSIDIQYNYTLNDQIQCLRHDMEMLRSQMVIIKQNIVQQSNNKLTQMNENHHNHHQQQQQQQPQQSNHLVNGKTSHSKESNNNINSKKVDKIKKDDPPPTLKQFLKKFGYEKYLKNFESEKIGITELMLLDEDRLQKLGIPMGPRLRLTQEIRNLSNNNNVIHKQQQQSMMDGNGRQQQQQQQTQQQQMTDNFNIYAVV